MLENLLSLILNTVLGFFTVVLLARVYMQRVRVSFRNQIGQFVVALTDWIVVPVRRVIPGLFGVDVASLIVAWATQTVLAAVAFALRGASLLSGAGIMALLWIGLVETAVMFVYLLIGLVIVSAVLSWVNPYAPLAPFFGALTQPFLRPFQRVIPPIANIDLSPLVLLLALQVVLMLLGYVRGSGLALLAG